MFITVISQVLYPSRIVIVPTPYENRQTSGAMTLSHGKVSYVCEHNMLGGHLTKLYTQKKIFYFPR